MFAIGAIGFSAPWLLAGVLALPILWWLLRAVPPAALRRLFPAVTLLIGLKDPETTPHKTPWWLLLLRILAVAALIVGFAGPVLNPDNVALSKAPLLILRDAGWADAPDWTRRDEQVAQVLDDAARQGRPVSVIAMTAALPKQEGVPFRDAATWVADLPSMLPAPQDADYPAFLQWLEAADTGAFDTLWFADGLARDGQAELASALLAKGRVDVVRPLRDTMALRPAIFEDGHIVVTMLRTDTGATRDVTLAAFGPDPAGLERQLAGFDATFAVGEATLDVVFDLPSELRNRINRFSVPGTRSAGAVALADDSLKRRKVALFAGGPPREGQELISPLHYLRKALAPSADLIEAAVADSLLASPDVIVLADVDRMTPDETSALTAWVEAGGLLVRFAGPKLAATTLDSMGDDPLLPVRLRAGGRNVGGAMSWGAPKKILAFPQDSPFFDLDIPDDVAVVSQVIAQPGPDLTARTIASLQDGTPLVTRRDMGEGQVVLVHVTANAEWSNLPLSGLFVQMLDRLAISTSGAGAGEQAVAGQLWQPQQVMNAFGDLRSADDVAAIDGADLADTTARFGVLPGTYRNGDREIAVNVIAPDRVLAAAVWPDGVTERELGEVREQPLKAWLLAFGLAMMMADIVATLFLSGRLIGPRAGIAAMLVVAALLLPRDAQANDDKALAATRDTVLAYILTGDSGIDQASEAGLYGLSLVLSDRTAVEPADPIGIDLERDELAFFPIIYWPVTEGQKLPSDAAYAKLNTYLRTGGMILFDTKDANLGGFGSATANGRRLQAIARPLDIPALEPVPGDHVLTRSFYLLQDFPGRHAGRDVWVEAAPRDAVRTEGMPFRNLNDGVTPVVIGGNDWASAWAIGRDGGYLYPVGRGGSAGERQREIAYRFGVNLVMYVLTGNYKSDQVHVPALLERLGQ